MGMVNMNDGSVEFVRNLRDAMEIVRNKVSYDLANCLENFLNFPLEAELVAKDIEKNINSIRGVIKEKHPDLENSIIDNLDHIDFDVDELKCQYDDESYIF